LGQSDLEYGEISPNDEPAYYLRIIKKKKGKAKNCERFLTVMDTNVTYAASAWSLDAQRVIDIRGQMDLRLFRIEGNDTIAFLLLISKKGSEKTYNHWRILEVGNWKSRYIAITLALPSRMSRQ